MYVRNCLTVYSVVCLPFTSYLTEDATSPVFLRKNAFSRVFVKIFYLKSKDRNKENFEKKCNCVIVPRKLKWTEKFIGMLKGKKNIMEKR